MRGHRRAFSLAASFCFLILFAEQGIDASAPPIPKNVLVLFPYHGNLPTVILSESTLRREVEKIDDLDIFLFVEHLDLIRFPDPDYRDASFALIRRKYTRTRIDAVMVASKRMLDLWRARLSDIAPDAPVVFFDINREDFEGASLPPDYFGVAAEVDYRPAVDWATRILPPIKDFALVYGVGPTDEQFKAPIDLLIRHLNAKGISFVDLSDRPYSAVKEHVAGMGQGSAVIYHLLLQDASGASHFPLDVLRDLASFSKAPILVGHDHFVGEGALGGYVYSIESQAEEAARIVLSLLRDARAPRTRVVSDKGNRFMFDHAVMRAFKINVVELPNDAVLKNRHFSLGELYGREIAVIVVAFTVLLSFIVGLAAQKQRLDKARQALSALNADLESQVARRTADLSAALFQRGTLLKELNHRIKNNLQIVLSLIRLSNSDEAETERLVEAAGRIEAIANVHEAFNPEDAALEVGLDGYLARLAADTEGLRAGSASISIETVAESGVSVPMKTAASVGLIVNELLTNAFKYAYPHGAAGKVFLRSFVPRAGTVMVEVSDEGIGMDPEAARRNGSLGMGIVHSLAESLGASLLLDAVPGRGVKWTLELPLCR